MASSNDTEVNLTACPICFETFTSPKYLPCLHSFCEVCLQTYISSTFRINSDLKGINCPVCREYVVKPDKVAECKWAKEIPLNHLLVSIIDIEKAKTESQRCNACARDYENVTANSWCVNCSEALCEMCEKHHRKLKHTSQHRVVHIENIKQSDMKLESADLYCSEHPNEQVKAYCHDHSTVCCMTCITLTHRKCDNVQDVEKAAEMMKKSTDTMNLEKSFVDLKVDLEKITDARQKNLSECKTSLANMKAELHKLVREFITQISSLRSAALDEVAAMENKILPEIDAKINVEKCKVLAIENDIELYRTNSMHASPAQYLHTMSKLMEQRKTLEKFVKERKKNLRAVSITYQKNESIAKAMEALSSLGKVSVKHGGIKAQLNIPAAPSPTINPLHAVLRLRSQIYFKCAEAGGVAFLDDGRILISNYEEELLHLQCRKSRLFESLSLPGNPCAVKMLSAFKGAVAIQNEGLLFFRIHGRKIIEMHRVDIRIKYDFVYHKGNYYIGCSRKIVVLDSSFKKVREIPVGYAAVGYMALLDDNTLCYTHCWGDTLHCITLDGVPVFQYSHAQLQETIGVTVDFAGNIYVCGNASKNVHQLSSDGKLQRIMFKEITSTPYCIAFWKDNGRALIGCKNGVLIYDLA